VYIPQSQVPISLGAAPLSTRFLRSRRLLDPLYDAGKRSTRGNSWAVFTEGLNALRHASSYARHVVNADLILVQE